MLSNLPVFAHRNALLKLTTALERGEIAVGDAAEATALEEYRSAFLAKGFLLSALLGTAAFVKTDPFWILHKPRQWTKLGQLSAVIGGLGCFGLSAVSAVTAQECATTLLLLPRTEVTDRLRVELYKQDPTLYYRP